MIINNIAVIGSGISGASIAKMLAPDYKVHIYESSNYSGGLIKCQRVDDILFHKVGGHIFNSKNEKVLAWFWRIFDRDAEFIAAKRNAKVSIGGNLIGYPIENYLYQLPKNISMPIFSELLLALNSSPNNAHQEVQNFKDHLIKSFGLSLFNLYFKPYNEKIWNVDLSNIPLAWLDGKLPMPNHKDIIMSNLLREEESEMVHAKFFYPKKGGSQFIIDKLLCGSNLLLNTAINSIEEADHQGSRRLILNQGSSYADVVVYTGDVRKLHEIINIEDHELNIALHEVKALQSNGTTNILCSTDKMDISWLYFPENNVRAHRIIYTGNFSDTNDPFDKRSSCVVEFSGKYSPAEVMNDLVFLPGNLSPISFNHEPNSYIIQDSETRFKIKKIKALLQKHNIYLLGRFAEWEYFNMDKCIESAFFVADQIRSKH